jgi:hypothetical protein
MVKVICINSINLVPCDNCGKNINELKEGEVYIAFDFGDGWILEGKRRCSCGRHHAFIKNRFIPLSEIDEIDEMELLNNNKEKAVDRKLRVKCNDRI